MKVPCEFLCRFVWTSIKRPRAPRGRLQTKSGQGHRTGTGHGVRSGYSFGREKRRIKCFGIDRTNERTELRCDTYFLKPTSALLEVPYLLLLSASSAAHARGGPGHLRRQAVLRATRGRLALVLAPAAPLLDRARVQGRVGGDALANGPLRHRRGGAGPSCCGHPTQPFCTRSYLN